MTPNRERDQATLNALAEHGDIGTTTRPVFIWIFGSKSDLAAVASRLSATWQNIEPQEAEGVWVIAAEREQAATVEVIFSMSDEINAAVSGTAAEYDGWETSVERSN